MDEAKTRHLIELVKQHNIIWNRKNPNFKHLNKKNDIWKQIAKTCGVPESAAKRKWKGLRDSYSRHLQRQKIRGFDNSNDDSVNAWKYRKSMEFIKDHLWYKRGKNVQREDSSGAESAADESVSDVSVDGMQLQQKPEEIVCPISPYTTKQEILDTVYGCGEEQIYGAQQLMPPEEAMRETSTPNATNRRQHNEQEKTQLIDMLKSLQNFLQQQQQQQLQEKPDQKPQQQRAVAAFTVPSSLDYEDELYCRCLMEKLKKFPLEFKNDAKIGMLQYICKLEGDYNKLSKK